MLNVIKNGSFCILILALLLGCDGNSKDANQNIQTSQDIQDIQPRQDVQENYKPQTHIIEIKDMSFQPENLTVHKGDTVVWMNKDIVAHDVTQENQTWASPPIINEASWKKEINQSDSYYCSIHVVMKGTLTVE